MENTALQELIFDIQKHITDYNLIAVNTTIEMAKSKLLKEREQIYNAFVAGDERGTKDIPFNCEQYYSQTFHPIKPKVIVGALPTLIEEEIWDKIDADMQQWDMGQGECQSLLNEWKHAYNIQLKNYINTPNSLLDRAMLIIDDYLNAGFKLERKEASEKEKIVYAEYYGKDYLNRNERQIKNTKL